jgi:hypothetical protein
MLSWSIVKGLLLDQRRETEAGGDSVAGVRIYEKMAFPRSQTPVWERHGPKRRFDPSHEREFIPVAGGP